MKYLTDKYALLNKEGLGYESWLVLTQHKGYAPKSDTLEINGDDYHIHPFIRAKKIHADALGVEEGMLIAGVRWVDKGGSVHPEYIGTPRESKEGKYYDSDTDMYISYDEYQAMNEDQQLKAYDPSKGSWYVDDDGKVVANLPPEDDQNGFFGGW